MDNKLPKELTDLLEKFPNVKVFDGRAVVDKRIAIDIEAINHVWDKVYPVDIMEIYRDKGILFFKIPYSQVGNPEYKPVIIIE